MEITPEPCLKCETQVTELGVDGTILHGKLLCKHCNFHAKILMLHALNDWLEMNDFYVRYIKARFPEKADDILSGVPPRRP